MLYLPLFAATMLISASLSRILRDFARNRGWAVASTSARHVHQVPVPRIGGVAIFVAVLVVVGVWAALSRSLRLDFPCDTFLRVLGPTLLIFCLGLGDDFKPLRPHLKLGVEAIASVWLYLNGFGINRFQSLFGDHVLNTSVGLILTVGWLLLLTNAFNLLDGLDGLAAGAAIFSSIVVFIVSMRTGNTSASVMMVSLAGAISGFLRYNFNPATIFMGDCGSLVIGFLLGTVSLMSSAKSPTVVSIGIPVVAFGLPILDTTMAILRRFLNRRPLFSADSEHIHHKLLKRGLSHRQAVVVLYGTSAAFGLVSLSLLSPARGLAAVVLAIAVLAVVFGLQRLGYREMDELWRVARRTWRQKQIISNNLAIWRAMDQLATAGTFNEVIWILQAAFQETDYDGFELSFAPDLVHDGEMRWKHPKLKGLKLTHAWHKGECINTVGWSVTLNLPSGRGNVCGQFSLNRTYTANALYGSTFDCFAGEFATALTAALERITDEQQASMATTSGVGQMSTAVADAA
jgi:UDP-GlcNAc:undecaprenyl-phosphate GlcNAc-1-phosphate transferase